MKKRPKELTFVALFLLAVAIGLPVQVMMAYGHTPSELGAVAAKLAPLNWLIILFAPPTAWLIARASSWVLVALPLVSSLVLYNNYLVAQVGLNGPAWQMWAGSLAFLSGLFPIMTRRARIMLVDPNARWWMTPRRNRKEIRVRLKIASGEREFYVRTFDVSEGGAFISFDHVVTSVTGFGEHSGIEKFYKMSKGTQCFLSIPLGGLTVLQCRGEVVRNVPAQGMYPAGVGVRFLGLSWQDKKLLSEFLAKEGLAEKSGTDQGQPPASLVA